MSKFGYFKSDLLKYEAAFGYFKFNFIKYEPFWLL